MRYSKILFFTNLFCAFIFLGCAVDVSERAELPFVSEGDSSTPLVVYLNNPQNPHDFEYYYNIRKALNYAKIPIEQTRIQDFNITPVISSSTRVLVILDTYLLTESAMQSIVTFVANGGHLFIPNASDDVNFAFLAGVKSNAPSSIDPMAAGIKFHTNFLPGLKGSSYQMEFKHKGLSRENFENDIEVLATAVNDVNYPVLLVYKIGRGKTIVLNTTTGAQKADRGLYFAAILSGLQQIPYPIVNAGVIFLDDFPAPMYDIKQEPVASELNKSMLSFVTDVWWPDMLKLSREENIKYTAVVCFDYRDDTKPPFSMPEWETVQKNIHGRQEIVTDWLMREVKNSGNEIAFHGYNHISLLIEEWEREDFMETSVRTAYKKWRSSNYGKLPVTYVPPSNLIDSIGLASLEWGMPSIKYIASTYLGDFEEGGNREFDPEPYNRVFFDFPRITSGFIMDDQTLYNLQSLYLYTGIWSHFVHPDDVYQIEAGANEKTRGDYDFRNPLNLGWRKSANGQTAMLPRFTNFIRDLKQIYPQMRFIKAETAAAETQNWRYERYAHTTTEDLYKVSISRPQVNKTTWWFAYSSRENTSEMETFLKNSRLEYTKTLFQDGFLYNVKTNGTLLSLPNVLKNMSLKAETADALMAMEGFAAYLKADKAFATIDEEIEWFIAEGRVPEAISILKRKIETVPGSLVSDLTKLATYLGYVGREFEIWPVMETVYQQNTSEKNDLIVLSMQLVKNSDYPNLATRRVWMDRQVQLYPGNQELLQNYLAYFYEEARNLSPQTLINLINTAPDVKSKTIYSHVLLDVHPQDFMSFIADSKACTDDYLLPLADSIAWWYANNQQYAAATEWSKCTKNISRASILEWYALDGNEDYLKKNDYPKYIEYLLRYDTWNAVNLLFEVSPCTVELVPQSTNIAYAYANKGFYRKGIEWAGCSPEIKLREVLQWYYELRAIEDMEQIYKDYVAKNPEDHELKLYMAQVYAALGYIEKSWILATSLPESSGKDALQRLLNRDVIYIDRVILKELMKNYPTLFYPEVLHKLTKELRLKTGNTLEFTNEIVANRLQPTSIGTNVTYGFYDSKENKHLVSATQYIARSLNHNLDNPANITHSLYGIEYGFQSKVLYEKLNYTATARLEMDEYNDLFYRIQAGISQSKDRFYRSLSLSHKPAVTGPAYSLNIYKTNLTVYYEQKFFTDLFAVFLLEANYYNDDGLDGLLMSRIGKNYNIGIHSTLSPYAEAAGRLGNKDNRSGFPYWTIEERLHGGLGLRYSFKNPSSELEFGLEASAFADTFSDFFQRYRGSASFPLFRWCYLTTSADFYTIKNFYSNNFNIGVKYYFDNK